MDIIHMVHILLVVLVDLEVFHLDMLEKDMLLKYFFKYSTTAKNLKTHLSTFI